MADYNVLAAAVTITTGSNDVIRITEATGPLTFNVTLDPGTYYVYGNAAESGDLCTEILTQFNAASLASGNGWDYDCTYSAKVTAGGVTGAITISETASGAFSILWASGTTTFDEAILGFPNSNTSSTDSHTSTLSPSHTWCSNQPPALLYASRFEQTKHQRVTPSGVVHTFAVGDVKEFRGERYDLVTGDRVLQELSSTDTARTFESWWRIANDGRPVRLYRDASTAGVVATLSSADLIDTYVLDEESATTFEPSKVDGVSLFGFDLRYRKYVT